MFDLMAYKAQKVFSQQHLLTLQYWSRDEILQTLSLAMKLKELRRLGIPCRPLAGQKMAMIFTKPSMRTRVSFEVGCVELGGHPFMLTKEEIGIGTREAVQDVARVLSRYCDGIMIRTFAQSDAEGLAQFGSVPVINGLTDDYHPCQVLADMQTYYENYGCFEGSLAFVGDGNNMAASLLIICTKLGLDVRIACPESYEPPKKIIDWANENARESGSTVLITNDAKEAVQGAGAVYTDVWASMGQEAQAQEKNEAFRAYQVNAKLMSEAPEAIFLHCLPAHRGEEVTGDVIESPQSRVFDEAENRLHAQKAVMALLMGKGGLPA